MFGGSYCNGEWLKWRGSGKCSEQNVKERKKRKDFIVQQLETQAQHSCTLDMEHGCYGASKASNRTQHKGHQVQRHVHK